jgi:alkylresorcinol/alkylpyrone synthase
MNNITGGSSGSLGLDTPTAIAEPSIAAVAVKFPPNRYTQDEAIGALTDFAGPEFRRFALSSGVEFRNTALPLSRYSQLSGFTEANDAYVEIALDLAEQAFLAALDEAKVKPSEVDIVFSTTVTGLQCRHWRPLARAGQAAPGRQTRPAVRPGLWPGAAGRRMHGYLRAFSTGWPR